MEYSYFTQLFTGGVNKDVDPVALDLASQQTTLSVLADARNLVFERGLAVTRYGLAAMPGPPAGLPSTANLRLVRMLPISAHSIKAPIYDRAGFAVTDAPKLYSLAANQASSTVFTPTEITGPGFSQSFGYYADNTMVNGVVLLAGSTAGLVRWDPVAGVYTVIVSAPYQYVAGHLARAVAAYDLTLGATGYAQTVAWSVQGDEADFTSIGSGLTVLSDSPDAITGIKVAKGTVIVARSYGFHIGIPTGQYPAVYDWRKLSDMSIGVMHPASFVVYKDTLFFVSECGVHMFDLVEITDIGESIYKEMNELSRQYGLTIRGFISPGYSPDFQPSYNLVLDSHGVVAGSPETILPHYMFNLREQKWTRHFYVNPAHSNNWSPLVTSMDYLPANSTDPAAISVMAVYQRVAGSSPTLQAWTASAALDTPASFTTGAITLGDPASDIQVVRMLLVYYAPPSAGFNITFVITYILNGVQTTSNVTLPTYPAGGWDRRWINFRATGNMFQVTCTLAVGTPAQVKFKSLTFEYSISGNVRT